MNSFESMGQAQLDAAEGQRMLAGAFARWVGKTSARVLDFVCRHLPEGKTAPW